MRVLIALNENGTSENKSNLSITASGQQFDDDQRVLTARMVDNVVFAYDGLEEKPYVFMDIQGTRKCWLRVSVANQEAGDNLIRKLCEVGYLDLTCYDVCMENFEEQGYL